MREVLLDHMICEETKDQRGEVSKDTQQARVGPGIKYVSLRVHNPFVLPIQEVILLLSKLFS